MSDKTKIAWSDATWTPIRARVKSDAAQIAEAKGYTSLIQIAAKMAGHIGPHCEHVSDGCKNCYSETNNCRCLPSNGTGLPFDRRSRDLVEIFIDEKILLQPLHWKKPRKIFAFSQTDLFGEWVPDEMIDRIVQVMLDNPQHTYQILTKRHRRMFDYFSDPETVGGRAFHSQPPYWIWLGVSVESREHKERIEILRETPAAVRFLSIEPLLEDIGTLDLGGIDWVIVGGESGTNARPLDLQWALDIIAQCKAAGVAPFMKQAGARPMYRPHGHNRPSALFNGLRLLHSNGYPLKDRAGADPSEWPEDVRVQEFPHAR